MSADSAMEGTESTITNVPIVVESKRPSKQGREHMVELMDGIEKQIESLRAQVAFMEEEKDNIFTLLDTLRQSTYVESLLDNDKEEINLNLDRLSFRVSSVEVALRTIRDPMQEEALSEVNNHISKLIGEIDRDSHFAKVQCMRFLNTCSSDPDGATDMAFEAALLGCTLDDQKRVHKRLHGLLDYLERVGVAFL